MFDTMNSRELDVPAVNDIRNVEMRRDVIHIRLINRRGKMKLRVAFAPQLSALDLWSIPNLRNCLPVVVGWFISNEYDRQTAMALGMSPLRPRSRRVLAMSHSV